MNIVFLVFGDKAIYHLQTYFAVLSILRHRRDSDTITVYSDEPSFYERLRGHIEVETISKRQLEEWIDGTGYVFRAKIMAIGHSAAKHPGSHLLFLDSDTYITGGLDDIERLLDGATGVMHKDEGHPSAMKGASLRMWNAVKGREVAGCRFAERHNVWNSGVIGIPKDNLQKVIAAALEICDFIVASGAKCFTAEQYAFAAAMREAGDIVPAERWVVHYWGNKDRWYELERDFMLRSFMSCRSVEQELDDMAGLNLEALPLRVRTSNTKRRLAAMLDRMFPDKVVG